MKTSTKVIAIALPIAIVAFMLGRIIWPDPIGWAGPDATLIPHFIFISALESISFGLGIAFAILGWLKFRAQIVSDRLSLAVFVAVVWLLVSWWPHDNMHRANAIENFGRLLRIEYTFHVTIILAGFIIALYFWRKISRTSVT